MSSKAELKDVPPQSLTVTSYDWDYRVEYLRLLDADADGADWQEAIEIIFGFDVGADPERARRIHDSHLARAKWMTHTGYRHLLQPHH